jgi:hypothetical protein
LNRRASTHDSATGPDRPSSNREYPRRRRRWVHERVSRAAVAVAPASCPDEARGHAPGTRTTFKAAGAGAATARVLLVSSKPPALVVARTLGPDNRDHDRDLRPTRIGRSLLGRKQQRDVASADCCFDEPTPGLSACSRPGGRCCLPGCSHLSGQAGSRARRTHHGPHVAGVAVQQLAERRTDEAVRHEQRDRSSSLTRRRRDPGAGVTAADCANRTVS